MSDADLKSLVLRFYALQNERVEAYRLFEEGHQAYLRTSPHYGFVQYRQLVHEITLAFGGISKEMIQIKDRFREVHGRSDLAQHIERMQEHEKEKLELVRLPAYRLQNRTCWTTQGMIRTKKRCRN
ncbi:required for excision 1-B domain-containing protein isoform X2 [Ambystoma mexicanum]|uniref:required for excision 1-B domain-containing protein isoform X2 n=1 Tax=Ambystoma mexicanum TaxID=8296 RepID=UPI0037E978A5